MTKFGPEKQKILDLWEGFAPGHRDKGQDGDKKMRITVSYTGENYMPFELGAVIDEYAGKVCKCGGEVEILNCMNELRQEIACWIGSHAEGATSPCDFCHVFERGNCGIQMRARCGKYRFYQGANRRLYSAVRAKKREQK
jgi:hypothetical protein